MKYKEYSVGTNKVEYYNSIIGKEKVKLNGKVVSSKKTFFGTIHKFNSGSDTYVFITNRDFADSLSVKVSIIKNEKLVIEDMVRDKNLLLLVLVVGFFMLWVMSRSIV